MTKFLLFVFLVAVAVLAFKTFKRKTPPREGGSPPRRPVEHMVVCAHCGVHLPESDSVRSDSRYFCSEEHRRLAQ